MPALAVAWAGEAMVCGPPTAKLDMLRTPVQVPQLAHGTPGWKFGPMQESLVSRKAKVSPVASPERLSLAAPPELVSIPWPHSWRKTAAISPVFEQPPPER